MLSTIVNNLSITNFFYVFDNKKHQMANLALQLKVKHYIKIVAYFNLSMFSFSTLAYLHEINTLNTVYFGITNNNLFRKEIISSINSITSYYFNTYNLCNDTMSIEDIFASYKYYNNILYINKKEQILLLNKEISHNILNNLNVVFSTSNYRIQDIGLILRLIKYIDLGYIHNKKHNVYFGFYPQELLDHFLPYEPLLDEIKNYISDLHILLDLSGSKHEKIGFTIVILMTLFDIFVIQFTYDITSNTFDFFINFKAPKVHNRPSYSSLNNTVHTYEYI